MEQERQNKINKITNYLIGQTVGCGTFSKVKLASHIPTGQKVAVKVIEKKKINDQADLARINRQIKILRKIRHPNIMQLYQIIETPRHLFLITEYIANGQLFDYIVQRSKLDQSKASFFLQQLLNAVQYIHKLGIVHRDLKPQNLLLDQQNNIKVVDFGLSNIYAKGETLGTACGSPCYAAPEMVSGQRYNGLRTDIWSCGIILFAMICGYLPFQNDNNSILYKKIISGVFKIPAFVSDTARDLLIRVLNVDPQQRYTIDQIRQHPFCQPNIGIVPGIILGISKIPVEPNLVSKLQTEGCENIEQLISNNKHNSWTAYYYLQLQKKLRAENKTFLDYFFENQKYLKSQLRLLRKALARNPRESLPSAHVTQLKSERLSQRTDRRRVLSKQRQSNRQDRRLGLQGPKSTRRSESQKISKILRHYGDGKSVNRKVQLLAAKTANKKVLKAG